jgi:rfaE bifunctional protein nucleotidyltransferase chain/domain
MFAPLEWQVLATLAYSDQFNYPLSLTEIFQRLVSPTTLRSMGMSGSDQGDTVNLAAVTSSVKNLVKRGLVIQQGRFFGLISATNQFVAREGRAKIAQRRLTELKNISYWLSKIPWVLAVATTGSTAMNNAVAQADYDLLVITAPNRLWITRLVALGLAAALHRHSRSGWCFNLWLEPATLALSPQRQGAYEAYELWQCQWLWDRANWGQVWLDQNQWYRQFLPQATTTTPIVSRPKAVTEQLSSDPGWLPLSWGNGLNYLVYLLQACYRKIRYGEVFPPLNQAFFHHPTARWQIYRRWQQILNRLTLLPTATQQILAAARAKNHRVVLVTGVFDLLHAEHRLFLQKACQQGDVLVIGVESDVRVRQMKGPGRPVNSQAQRKKQLEKLKLAEAVFILPEEFFLPIHHEALISAVQPAVLAVSAHTAHQAEKAAILQKYGGQVIVVHEHNPAVSSTKLLQQKRQKL